MYQFTECKKLQENIHNQFLLSKVSTAEQILYRKMMCTKIIIIYFSPSKYAKFFPF